MGERSSRRTRNLVRHYHTNRQYDSPIGGIFELESGLDTQRLLQDGLLLIVELDSAEALFLGNRKQHLVGRRHTRKNCVTVICTPHYSAREYGLHTAVSAHYVKALRTLGIDLLQ